MGYKYSTAFYRKKTRRESDQLEWLLKDWYGRKVGANEIIPHLPKAELLKDGVDKALKSLVNADTALLQKVKREWNTIAGDQLAKYTAPSSFFKGTLYIEVSHPAWLMQLGKNEKDMLLNNIHAYLQNQQCKSLKFVPPGRRRKL